jgi:galactonate dehydratase
MELGRDEYAKAMDLIGAVYETVKGKAQIYIEMHGRFSPNQAVEICKDIEGYRPGFVEEPCRPLDIGALKYVIDHTSVPIAAGERWYVSTAYNEVFANRLVNVVQPDISQCGGLFEVKKISSAAEQFSIMVAPHNVGGVIATAANIHLMFTLRNGKVLEHFNDFSDSYVKDAAENYPEVVNGAFMLPEGNGWGVEVDTGFLEKHEAMLEGGVIRDPGLDMFRKEKWNRRTAQ